ncbi:hypothetical protein F4703DRAFT_1543651 [Phycomyces blakesleeanus]
MVGLSTMSLLRVKVPVLSEHKMVTAAISSMAVIRVTIALCSASCLAPMARVTDKTVGMAMGIPPMSKTSMLSTPRRDRSYQSWQEWSASDQHPHQPHRQAWQHDRRKC